MTAFLRLVACSVGGWVVSQAVGDDMKATVELRIDWSEMASRVNADPVPVDWTSVGSITEWVWSESEEKFVPVGDTFEPLGQVGTKMSKVRLMRIEESDRVVADQLRWGPPDRGLYVLPPE